MSGDIYLELILDHYRNPRNHGRMPDAHARARDANPLCGDEVEIYMKFDGDRISEISFDGQGCAISQASASILTELVKGKSLDEAKRFDKQQLLESMGLPNLGPVRIKCALLPLKVFKLALYSHMGETLGAGEA
jgi:nitrogen fixation NifU-like protein